MCISMAVFHSSESDNNFEIGEYQQFPKSEHEDAATERTEKQSKWSGT